MICKKFLYVSFFVYEKETNTIILNLNILSQKLSPKTSSHSCSTIQKLISQFSKRNKTKNMHFMLCTKHVACTFYLNCFRLNCFMSPSIGCLAAHLMLFPWMLRSLVIFSLFWFRYQFSRRETRKYQLNL